MANVIELKNVDKIYRGAIDTQVLFDINLAFEEGSFNSLVGESGSISAVASAFRALEGDDWG